MENFHASTLNITITSNLAKYSTEDLSITPCKLESYQWRSIPLPRTSAQEMCVLASVQDRDTFVSARYFALKHPDQYAKHVFPGYVLLLIVYVLLLLFCFIHVAAVLFASCGNFYSASYFSVAINLEGVLVYYLRQMCMSITASSDLY